MSREQDSASKSPADWSEWKRINQNTIHHTPYEWDFAMDVITKVVGLKPSQVKPQYPFTGTDGREYRMDFAIITKRIKIAIELEGWDKTNSKSGKNKKEHDEFNRRLQDLTIQGWTTLPVTNAQFKLDKMKYITMIRQLISDPQPAPVVVVNQDNSEVLSSIEDMSGMVRKLASNQKENSPITVVHDNSSSLTSIKKTGVVGIAVIAALLVILIFTLSKNVGAPGPTPANQAPIGEPQEFKNCAALKVKYPNGVAQSQEDKDRKLYSNPVINSSVYNANQKLDANGDGVMCDSN